MNTDESSVVGSLVAAQQAVLSAAGRAERRRVSTVLLLLRARRNEGVLALYRLRKAATPGNVEQTINAMRSHIRAASMFEVLADLHLGQLYGFPAEAEELDRLLMETETQFCEAEGLALALGVDCKVVV